MSLEKRGAALVVAAVLCAGQVAAAGEPGAAPLTDRARVDAEKRNAEGLARYARGDYDGARLAFQQAWSVLASVDLLYNLSRAEVKSGHALEALVHLRQIIRNPKATPEDKEKAQRLIDEANRVTAHIAVDAPPGATIYIDKVESGDTPVSEPFDVAPGKHVCEMRADGTTRVIEVDASMGAVVTARFAGDAAHPTVTVEAVPQPAAPAAAPMQPPPEDKAPARPERRLRESPSRAPETNARVIVPLVIGGAAVVAAGVGGIFGLVSKGKEDDATSFRSNNSPGFCAVRSSPLCSQYASLLDSQQSATNIERVLLVTSGVLAVGAIVTYVAWPKERGREAAWVAPQVGPGGAGVAVGGAF